MASWADFEAEARELAQFVAGRLRVAPAYLATINARGVPRVHPVTPILGAAASPSSGSRRHRGDETCEIEAGTPSTTAYPTTTGLVESVERLAEEGIAGRSVYDALVGAVAADHGMALATRDRRRARDLPSPRVRGRVAA